MWLKMAREWAATSLWPFQGLSEVRALELKSEWHKKKKRNLLYNNLRAKPEAESKAIKVLRQEQACSVGVELVWLDTVNKGKGAMK